MHRLFEDHGYTEQYTPAGSDLHNELKLAVMPIIKRYVEAQYSGVDIEAIGCTVVSLARINSEYTRTQGCGD